MSNLEDALKKHELTMPEPPAKGGVYVPVREFGQNLCYSSGCIPVINGEVRFTGKVGREISIEQGQEAARLCALNILANLKAKYGTLDRIKQIVKVLVFIACAEDFYEHAKVGNGASEFFIDVFGEEIGCGARSSIGVYVLPRNVPVEVEILVELK
jgi:enamine deaminase RidA (YjgF/YER057c/UK114 family)